MELFLMSHNSHALTTTSKRSLNDNREANFLAFRKKEFGILVVSMIAWDNRYLGVTHDEL
jgi:hypothetical protein